MNFCPQSSPRSSRRQHYKFGRCIGPVICGILGLITAAPISFASPEPARPNVLMISIDDLNDWVNCLHSYGGKVYTPNIDRLAARGRLFTNAHSVVSRCGPSRNATFSGLNPWTTGCYDNGTPMYYNHPDFATLPRYLRDNGYHTAGVGKLFHQTMGFNDPTAWDEYPNYDHHYGSAWLPARAPLNGLDHEKHHLGPSLDWGPLEEGSSVTYDRQTVDRSVEFLRRLHDGPFFLAAGVFLPHIPLYAPQKYFDLYPLESIVMPPVKSDDMDDIPAVANRMTREMASILKLNKLRDEIQAYLACITYVDAQIGRLLDALEASAYHDNTVIVLWSDHGYHFGEKNQMHKFTLWERATRVPLIIAGPGVKQAGVTTTRPVSLLDLYPTLIDLCDLPAKPELDGVSLLPLLKDPASPRMDPALMSARPGDFAVRTERWRYIRYRAGEEELYDHESDPNEWTNLAADPRHRALKADLAKWIPATLAPPGRIRSQTHSYNSVSRRWIPKIKEP